MEALIFIAVIVLLIIPIILIILVVTLKNTIDRQFIILTQSIDFLRKQIERLSNQELEESQSHLSEPTAQKDYDEKPVEPIQEGQSVPPVFVPEVIEEQPIVEETSKYIEPEPVFAEYTAKSYAVESEPTKAAQHPGKPGFFERNPDLEKFIGENLINKIGIAILVLGIGFFVKYAIDKEWINEIGRVFIGLICGGALLGVAHKTRKDFKAFSSVLVGGGMAVFYFTITIAFHEYHLFPQTIAFVILIIITAFTVLLSIVYNRIELAVLAIIGGFISPFLISTGDGNYIVLFSYILILNMGMLVLAYYKNWNLVNLVCYVFTLLLYGSWLGQQLTTKEIIPVTGGLIFATLFYLVFFLMNIINNIREKRKFLAFNLTILISNTFLYYASGMLLLEHLNGGIYRGLFTVVVAIFNFVFAFILYKNKKADMNLVYLLIGLVLTFLSLSAPVQLKGNYITLFWAFEAVLLLWLSQKSGIKLIKAGAMIVMTLMFISLIMDWSQMYSQQDHLSVALNKAFVTTVVALVSVYLSIVLLRNEAELLFGTIQTNHYKNLLKIIFVTFLYSGLLLEITHQLDFYFETSSFREVLTGIYNFIFIIGFYIYTKKTGLRSLKELATLLGIFGVLMFLMHYHQEIISLRFHFLETQEISLSNFLYHYVLVALVGVVIFLIIKNTISLYGLSSQAGKIVLWFISFVIVFLTSAELDHIAVINGWDAEMGEYLALSQSHKIGYPILWGVCSFVFMIIGMKNKIKALRIISLTLFFITLIKLFVFDIQEISEGGKIAAFICLGLLLLIISFMYQKLKKIILEGEVKSEV